MLNRKFGRVFLPALAAVTLLCGRAAAQGATAFIARAGVVASSALVTDEVSSEGEAEAVSARIGPAPVITVGVHQTLAPRVAFEATVGYTFGSWQADDAGGWRDVESVGVAEASVALVRSFGDLRMHGAVGALSYRAPARGIFVGEAGMRPFLEAGGSWRTPLAGRRVELQLRAQAHNFGTSGIRAAGGLDGRVFRAALSAGYTFGGAE